jgi:hypothetical protein
LNQIPLAAEPSLLLLQSVLSAVCLFCLFTVAPYTSTHF